MSYRSSSPVSGFGGHVPGNKWQVGSKSQNISNNSQLRNQAIEPEPTLLSEHSHTFDFEGNPIPRFSPYFIPPMTPAEYTIAYNQQMANFQAANNGSGSMMQQYSNPIQMYGFNPAFSMNGEFPQNGPGGGMASSASMQRINNSSSQQQLSPGNHQQNSVNGQQTRNDGNNQGQQQQQKSRSKSMPRKPKSDVRDMFGGIESGWWSEGQALKNIRRHQQSQAEASGISSGNTNDHTSSNSTISRYRRNGGDRDFDDDDVPAPGYSGHIPGIRTHGIGKPFTVAAKESRRIMHSNENTQAIQAKGRSDKDQNSQQQRQQQNNSQTAASRQQQFIPPSSMNGFPQQPQPFMNSYPFMAPNGMMQQPMYMGLPLQGQGQPNLQNNINPPDF